MSVCSSVSHKTPPKMWVKPRAETQVHRRHELELAPPGHHFQCAIHILPLIAVLTRHDHPMPPQGPTASREGVQAHTALVSHPHLHGATPWQIKPLQFFQ